MDKVKNEDSSNVIPSPKTFGKELHQLVSSHFAAKNDLELRVKK
jgi:hypothetical protein